MATIIIQSERKEKIAELKKMAKSLGVTLHTFSKAQEEDYRLAKHMQKSEKSGKANTKEVLKLLGL